MVGRAGPSSPIPGTGAGGVHGLVTTTIERARAPACEWP